MLYLWHKGHKIKDCESKHNIFIAFRENLIPQELKRIMEKYGTVKSIKVNEVQLGQKNQPIVSFSKKNKAQVAITKIKCYEGWNAEVYRNRYYKKTVKFQAYMKIRRHNANTKKKTEGDLEKKLEKMRNHIKEIKKGHCEQK